jgi:hypothetical protein
MAGIGATSPFARAPTKDRSPPTPELEEAEQTVGDVP